MNSDGFVSQLIYYQCINIVVWVEHVNLSEMPFGESYLMAQPGHNTTFKVTVNDKDYNDFCLIQGTLFAKYQKLINSALLKIADLNKVVLQLFNWKVYINKVLSDINKPFNESTITSAFKLKGMNDNVQYYGNEYMLSKYFLDCQTLICSTVLEPINDYISILEKQVEGFEDFMQLKQVLDASITHRELAVALFDDSKLSVLTAIRMFTFLRDEKLLISSDSTQDIFLGMFEKCYPVDKIKWIGTKSAIRTFIQFLGNKNIIPPQPWELIRQSFVVTEYPQYLNNPKVSAGSFTIDNDLLVNLEDICNR